MQLFEARTGKVLLTEAGHALLHYATKIHALAEESNRVLQEYHTIDKGTLHIGASYVPGTYLLPDLATLFTDLYKGMTVKICIKPTPVIRQMLLDHTIDIGLISSQPFESPHLQCEILCEDELVIACSPNHPFMKLDTISTQAVGSTPFILHDINSSTRQITEQWAAASGIVLQAQLEFDSLEAIKRAVMRGQGITFISRMAVQDEMERGLLHIHTIPEHTLQRHIYVCHHRERWLSARMNAFIEMVFK